MPSVKDQLVELSSGIDALVELANSQESISDDLLSRVDDLESEISDALADIASTTEASVERLREELALLTTDVARAIGLTGVLNYKGRHEQAEALKSLGSNVSGGQVVGGLFQMIGDAILGALVERGLERVGKAIRDAGEADPRVGENALIALIYSVQSRRPYLTFNCIVSAASDPKTGILSDVGARRHLLALIAEGVVELYAHGELSALRLNASHPRVKKLLSTESTKSPSVTTKEP